MSRHDFCKPRVRAAELLNLGAAALDEDAEHNDEQHAGDNSDNRYLIHVESPFSQIPESWLASFLKTARLAGGAHAGQGPARKIRTDGA